ncbi:MAG: hypothetical protein Q6368_003110 [Candidatus Baldrarchaeota archaeon]
MLYYEDKNGVVRFRKAKNREELKKQFDIWKQKAREGKTLCLTDMLISIEELNYKKRD